MKRIAILTGIICAALSCHPGSASGKKHGEQSAATGEQKSKSNGSNESDGYTLHFNPPAGSRYYYNISNETATAVEAGGKTVNNLNRSAVGLAYEITKDKSDNFLLHMRYDKLQVYTKSSDTETELDAANAATTADPVEKMLGIVKDASIVATVNPAGAVTSLDGYKELGAKIMATLNNTDMNSRLTAQSQWDRTIGEGVIKKNMDQLVGLLPNKPIQIGDTWQTKSIQKGEISFTVTTRYTLKDVDDGVAFIESEGDMESDNTSSNLMGATITGQLKGVQKGEYQVKVETGMLLKNSITGKVEGTIQVLGQDVPITIENKIKMNGREIK